MKGFEYDPLSIYGLKPINNDASTTLVQSGYNRKLFYTKEEVNAQIAIGDTNVSNRTIPEVGAVNMRYPELNKLYSDLQSADTVPVDIIVVGDSISEFGWVTTFYREMAIRYNGDITNGTATTGPVCDMVVNYTGAIRAMTTPGGTVTEDATAGYGSTMTAGQSASHTAVCDGVFVVWRTGTGTLTVRDGGAGGTIVATIDTSTGTGTCNITSVNLTTYASHNIWIGSTGNTQLDGVLPTVGNRTRGIRVWNISHTGRFAEYLNDHPDQWSDFIGKVASLTGRQPHVIVSLGYNDVVATYGTIYTTFMNTLISKTTGALALWNNWSINGIQKRAAVRALATTYNMALVDGAKAFGNISTLDDTDGWSGDGVHPTDAASLAIATHFLMVCSGDPIGILATVSRFGNWEHKGTLSYTTNSGKFEIISLFGFPIIALYDTATDTGQAILFAPATITAAVFGISKAALIFGPGGSTLADTLIFRQAAGVLGTRANASAEIVAIDGVINTNTTNVGNVTTGEDDLMTYSLPANLLGVDLDQIDFEAAGTLANNANAKRIRIKYGATTILDTGAAGLPASVAASWTVKGKVIRTGAATQKVFAELKVGNGTTYPFVSVTTAAETLSGAVTFKLTGDATATNDIIQQFMTLKWQPANT